MYDIQRDSTLRKLLHLIVTTLDGKEERKEDGYSHGVEKKSGSSAISCKC